MRRLVDVLSTLEEGEEEGQAASSLIAVICRLTEDLRCAGTCTCAPCTLSTPCTPCTLSPPCTP